MDGMTVVIGYGAIGRETVKRLTGAGRPVRVAQRNRPADLPAGVAFQPCDVLDPSVVRKAVEGAAQVVVAVGFAYEGRLWQDVWPRTMTNLVEACAAARARMVFVDNLYMYGPQRDALREDMPLSAHGRKPAARAEATRIWMRASEAGRVRVAALRAPDFYGPGVTLSHLGDLAFGAVGRGKPALLLVPPDMPHDCAYVPDIARAVVTLLDAPDDAFGQAWHVPCAPTRTLREILDLGAAALGAKLRLRVLPPALLRLSGLVVPMMREFSEMSFQWDRPYHVDASKFARRFWPDATPFDTGAAATARSFARSRHPLQACAGQHL